MRHIARCIKCHFDSCEAYAHLIEFWIVRDHPVGALEGFASLQASGHEVIYRPLQIFLVERYRAVNAIHLSANFLHEEPPHWEVDGSRCEDQLAINVLHDTQVLLQFP